jgi:hypothetical protein
MSTDILVLRKSKTIMTPQGPVFCYRAWQRELSSTDEGYQQQLDNEARIHFRWFKETKAFPNREDVADDVLVTWVGMVNDEGHQLVYLQRSVKVVMSEEEEMRGVCVGYLKKVKGRWTVVMTTVSAQASAWSDSALAIEYVPARTLALLDIIVREQTAFDSFASMCDAIDYRPTIDVSSPDRRRLACEFDAEMNRRHEGHRRAYRTGH